MRSISTRSCLLEGEDPFAAVHPRKYEVRSQKNCATLRAYARAIDRAVAELRNGSAAATNAADVNTTSPINTLKLLVFITTVHIMMRTPHPGRSAKLSIIELSQY